MSKTNANSDEYKVFNDPVHGTIRLHPLLVKIIDTPEFQRLRNIKQLGGAYYIYPGAQHNRFEHSIGTAHLAGKLVRHLQYLHSKDGPAKEKIEIDDQDVLCVEIAGLCHDLGHGPFSHLFDRQFFKETREKDKKAIDNAEVTKGVPKQEKDPEEKEIDWTHEQGSRDMFKRIMKNNSMRHYIENMWGKEAAKKNRKFVKEMIKPPMKKQEATTDDWPYEGRDVEKSFLYEIIANKKNGVDVDKWDYFARDCHHLGIANGFDHNRFIQFTRVVTVNGKRQICVRDKEAFNLYEMFHTRFALHKRAYQHKSVKAVEHMICDAMVAANNCVRILGNGTKDGCKISDCIEENNLGSFCNLDDSILQKILLWVPDQESGKDPAQQESCSGLEIAKDILKRLARGQRYKCVGNKILGREACKLNENAIKKAIAAGDETLGGQLRVSKVKFNYGCGDKNPIENYRFYKKGEETEAIEIQKEEVSFLLPDVFEERVVQVFCVGGDEAVKAAKEAFKKWYKKPETSTKQLLRNFIERTEKLAVTDAEAKTMIREIHASLDKKI